MARSSLMSSFASLVMVGLIAGSADAQQCAGDIDRSGNVTVDELVTAVNAALNGCPPPQLGQLTGTWTGQALSDFVPGAISVEMHFQQEGINVTGNAVTGSQCFTRGLVAGLIQNGQTTGLISESGVYVAYSATVSTNRMDGRYFVVDGGDCTDDAGSFTLRR